MTDRRSAVVLVGYTEYAGRLLRNAAGCDVELILLTVMPTAEFQARG